MHTNLTVLGSVVFLCFTLSPSIAAETVTALEAGRNAAFDRNKGNCLACHAIPNDPAAKAPGNIGPPLFSIKARFPDRAKLRAQIWDATVLNPNTSMPPFGKNNILTEPEIDLVTDYIYEI